MIKKVLLFLLVCSITSHATIISTHWMVTESGLIKPWLDSPFEMNNPFDLLAFLNQDTRWENIINIYHELAERQQLIDKLWSALKTDTNIGLHLSTNADCLKAESLKLVNWYTFLLEKGISKRLSEEDFMFDFYPSLSSDHNTDVPECKKISSLTFSMFAFDHLEGLKNRNNLNMTPEITLLDKIDKMTSAEQLGHWVSSVLKHNSSSWLHYKMAALYWMIKGNAPKALECSRRAVHYVPREFKDIALLTLGSVLHRSKATEDAIIVLNAAVDHNPNHHINHFVLANAYAVYGDFNLSIIHYDKSLKINPEFELALKHKNAVLCTESIRKKMKNVERNLKLLIEELAEYSGKETHWIKSQAAFLKTMRHREDYDYRNVQQNCKKMGQLTGLDILKVKADGDRNSVIKYVLASTMYDPQWLKVKGVHIIDSAYSMQQLVKHVEKHANSESDLSGLQVSDHIVIKDHSAGLVSEGILEIPKFGQEGVVFPKVSQIDHKPRREQNDYETGIVIYPPTMKINRNIEDFDQDSSWPSDLFCLEKASSFPSKLEAIYPVFLPFENKGIRLKHLLTEKIGVSVTKEHELPWHPPNCPQSRTVTCLTQRKANKQNFIAEVVTSDNLRLKLLEYVGDGDANAALHMQDAEIGHRIYAAMKKGVVPKWITYTLASLYWRVRGNNVNALHCLVAAGKLVHERYKDIVFASMSSIYSEMGYFDESLQAAEEAFKLSPYEPTTNFLLAQLNMLKKHRNTHLFHLKQVVRVDAYYLNGVARNLLDAWICVLKNIEEEEEFAKEDICAVIENGVNMVCEKDGNNCQITKKKCMQKEGKSDSTVVRFLKHSEMKDALLNNPDQIFDKFLEKKPKENTDIETHTAIFSAMMKELDYAFKGCGTSYCHTVAPQELGLQEDDCSYQHLQLAYWIDVISFKEMKADKDIRLPAELINLTPSSKVIPECHLEVDPRLDFFLEKIVKVDLSEWAPNLGLMQEYASMFDDIDYGIFGSKIAKFVDMKPGSWVGALGAGWWCGFSGQAACAVRCLAAAHRLAPPARAPHALRALVAVLHLNSKPQDAKDIAYLLFYNSPMSKVDAFLVAVSHAYLDEFDQAVLMFRYSLTFDKEFLPSKACLHATLCLILFKSAKNHPQHID